MCQERTLLNVKSEVCSTLKALAAMVRAFKITDLFEL